MAIFARSLRPMSGARPSDGLLPALATMTLLNLLARRRDAVPQEQLIRDLVASTPASWSRASNTVAKLLQYGVIKSTPSGLMVIGTIPQGRLQAHIAERVAKDVVDRLSEADAWSCLRHDTASGRLSIDSMTLPRMHDGLAVWVTEFQIAERALIASRHWLVSESHQGFFLNAVRQLNRRTPRRSKSAERLAAELAQQAEHGLSAELWVLEFERARLRDHPFRDQIRHISPIDVTVGYDIASFAGLASLRHDLFIEVKSHSVRKAFHWSRNEIATALAFGEEYALYLVDRSRQADPAYAPQIITAPSPEMFAQPDSGWIVEATSFEHVAVVG